MVSVELHVPVKLMSAQLHQQRLLCVRKDLHAHLNGFRYSLLWPITERDNYKTCEVSLLIYLNESLYTEKMLIIILGMFRERDKNKFSYMYSLTLWWEFNFRMLEYRKYS